MTQRQRPAPIARSSSAEQRNSHLSEGERTAEALARDFLDSARDLISFKDIESRNLFVNRQFETTVHARH